MAGAWILGTAATSGLAWAAVNRVETRLTTTGDNIVSPSGVDQAVAPLAVSSTTERRADPGASPGDTNVVVTTVVPPTSPTARGPASAPTAAAGATTTVATTITAAPPTVGPTTTAPPPPSTTTNKAPTVISTAGGSVAVTCPSANTIRLEYATPNPGWVFSPIEIEPEHVHVKFSKSEQVITVEIECEHGKAEASLEDDR